jgi:negative regulator of sigma E activity
VNRLVRTGVALAAVAATAAPAAVVGQEPAADPLQAAGRAAEQLSFVGVLQVLWSERGQERSESLVVHGANGSVVVKGGTAVMAFADQRLVEHADDWNLLWPSGRAAADRPAATRKYQLVEFAGPLVANRASRGVEVRTRAGRVVERLYLDQETDLLLRRDQFEGGQSPSRTVAFESLTIGAPVTTPPGPAEFKDAAPQVLSASRLPAGVSAPVALADGYQRVGLFQRAGVVQAVYSDGLYDLSIFEQQGSLDRRGLPRDARVEVGDERGWHWAWPGGHVVLWEDEGTVLTAVSDAPLEQVLAAVRSLPPAGASPSLLRRLRQVCRALVQPLAA